MTDERVPTTGPACPLCHQRMRSWMRIPADWRRPEIETSFQLYWCDADSYGCVWPYPSADEISAAYVLPEYYTHSRTGDQDDGRTRGVLERLRTNIAWRADHGEPITADYLHQRYGPSPLTICEIGCGNGRLLSELAAKGHSTYGVEPDPAALVVAATGDSRVVGGNAENLPTGLPYGDCDLVVFKHVLEHCMSPLSALRGARRLLKPSGVLLCEVPNNSARGLQQSGIAWHWLDVPRHLHFFTSESLSSFCARAELQVETTSFAGYSRQFDRNWIRKEDEIRARFRAVDPSFSEKSATWQLLLSTLFAAPTAKYDSVRVEARLSAE